MFKLIFMDDLIGILQNCKIVNDLDIENLITKLYHLDTIDQADEWDQLKKNYSKLLFINDILNESVFNRKIIFLIDRFMEYINNKTEYYLKHIEYLDDENVIVSLLGDSLNDKLNNQERLKLVLAGYKLIIDLISETLKEPFVEFIDDQKFLTDFNIKKRKRV
jgi:hypothetical protein